MPASVSLWVIAEALLCAIVVVNNFGSCLCESLALAEFRRQHTLDTDGMQDIGGRA